MRLETSRRAILAGLPALAEPNSTLAMAIERHKAAYVAFSASDGPDDVDGELSDLEGKAIEVVALTPCDEAAFLEKLRYLLATHKRLWGDSWLDYECPALMLALDLHFNPAEYA